MLAVARLQSLLISLHREELGPKVEDQFSAAVPVGCHSATHTYGAKRTSCDAAAAKRKGCQAGGRRPDFKP